MIGHSPVVEVRVGGKKIQCLVDTGSQVTLFSESLSHEVFGRQGARGMEAPWLTLKGANGLDIPYIGYRLTDLEIHGVIVPQKGVIIVQDHCSPTHRAPLGNECPLGMLGRIISGMARPENTAGRAPPVGTCSGRLSSGAHDQCPEGPRRSGASGVSLRAICASQKRGHRVGKSPTTRRGPRRLGASRAPCGLPAVGRGSGSGGG